MNLALFDLDYTLLAGDSDHAWGQFLVEAGMVDGDEYQRKNDEFWARYKAGTLDIREYLQFALAPLAGKSLAEMRPLHDQYLQKKIAPMVRQSALDLVRQHRNDLCAIVTATNTFVTGPIAGLFGIPHLIGCEVEIIDGRFTGEPLGVPSFREGKITRVNDWLRSMGKSLADFPQSFFYSDSMNDLPLLEMVNHPVAVNPDAVLRDLAVSRGWPVIQLHELP